MKYDFFIECVEKKREQERIGITVKYKFPPMARNHLYID